VPSARLFAFGANLKLLVLYLIGIPKP